MLKTIFYGFFYGLYILSYSFRSIKYKHILKTQGQEAALQYAFKLEKSWSHATLKMMGTTYEIRGRENLIKEPCLYVANHQSYFDVPLMMQIIDKPLGFVAKKEMEKVPVMGAWIKRINGVFIDRENVRDALKAISLGIKYLEQGHSMVIFPEGTRGKGGEVKEFKKGSLKLATKPGIPVVPITIDGAHNVLEANGRLQKAHVKITIHEPIYTNKISKEDQTNLSEKVKEIIVSAL